jgi:hypothetical protein
MEPGESKYGSRGKEGLNTKESVELGSRNQGGVVIKRKRRLGWGGEMASTSKGLTTTRARVSLAGWSRDLATFSGACSTGSGTLQKKASTTRDESIGTTHERTYGISWPRHM